MTQCLLIQSMQYSWCKYLHSRFFIYRNYRNVDYTSLPARQTHSHTDNNFLPGTADTLAHSSCSIHNNANFQQLNKLWTWTPPDILVHTKQLIVDSGIALMAINHKFIKIQLPLVNGTCRTSQQLNVIVCFWFKSKINIINASELSNLFKMPKHFEQIVAYCGIVYNIYTHGTF